MKVSANLFSVVPVSFSNALLQRFFVIDITVICFFSHG